jgi:hypothetical protein
LRPFGNDRLLHALTKVAQVALLNSACRILKNLARKKVRTALVLLEQL